MARFRRTHYSRQNNPNRAMLEESLALLENGAGALAFSSGNAASFALFQASSLPATT